MSMTITLSDHATHIVQNRLASYGSVESVIESALSKLESEIDENDPKYIEFMRQAIKEGLEGEDILWDAEEFEREAYRIFAAKNGMACQKQ
ncbi:MAG: hypothetical protein HQL94_01835 [Magnetococcales bacterium]|nr:hypothetical protein [Magnetococcales bacterium]